jgi:pimeloyl-ACP methyl ester carboxylesterase
MPRIRKFQKPVLLIKGTGSTKWLHHIVEGLAENLPNAKVVELPGGHAPQLVSKDSFLEILEKFQNR